jgi:hypothetical protein
LGEPAGLERHASDLPGFYRLFRLGAALSVMSNTATVTMLIPFAAAFIADPAVGVLIAVAASLGIPVRHQHADQRHGARRGRRPRQGFLRHRFPLMLAGCLLLALTGFYVLSFWFD